MCYMELSQTAHAPVTDELLLCDMAMDAALGTM